MSKFMLRRVIPCVLLLAFLVCFFPSAVSAAVVEELAYEIIDIAEPDKIYNDDGTVTVSYDLPVVPYVEMFGYRENETEPVLLGTGTHVNFQNGKIIVTEPAELLYDWDFTSSLTDSVSGVTAKLTKYNYSCDVPVQDDTGLHFTTGGIVNLTPGGVDLVYNRTVDIDLAYSNFSLSDGDYMNAILLSLVSPSWGKPETSNFPHFAWMAGKGWAWMGYDSRGIYNHNYLDPELYPLNFFSGKTVRFSFDALGYCTLYYAEIGSDDFCMVETFGYPFDSSDDLCEYMIGASQAFDTTSTFTGVRIYDNAKDVEVNEYGILDFDMLVLGNSQDAYRVLPVGDIRSGEEIELSFELESSITIDGVVGIPSATLRSVFLDANLSPIGASSLSLENVDSYLISGGTFSYTYDVTVPSGAEYLYLCLDGDVIGTYETESYTWILDGVTMTCDMSAVEDSSRMMSDIADKLQELVDQALETNECLDEIKALLEQIIDQMSANGCDHSAMEALLQQISDKQDQELSWLEKIWNAISSLVEQVSTGVQSALDNIETTVTDIFTGGDAGDDLISGGDVIENAGDGLGEDLENIQDFEDQYFAEFDNALDDIIAGADLNYLVSPLAFVQMYLDKIVAGVPSQFLVVFTLPILFGVFLYIVGHPIRAPRPDTSGDTVTRETFRETTVLSGPHEGVVTSTRTVTTSTEIGRVHNE